MPLCSWQLVVIRSTVQGQTAEVRGTLQWNFSGCFRELLPLFRCCVKDTAAVEASSAVHEHTSVQLVRPPMKTPLWGRPSAGTSETSGDVRKSQPSFWKCVEQGMAGGSGHEQEVAQTLRHELREAFICSYPR